MNSLQHVMKFLCLLALMLVFNSPEPACSETEIQPEPKISYGVIQPELLETTYSNPEIFDYEVSYTGGIIIGSLHLEILPIPHQNAYELKATVTTEGGAIHLIYPINDVHVTKVRGIERLPFEYEVWQKEGFHYEAHRLTKYDQARGKIYYKKNEEPMETYSVDGVIHNEFSSFFSSRLMPHLVGSSFIVPTFADKKRNEVVVHVPGRKHFDKTILGPVDTVEVTPIMKFKGLYDKQGDTVIWYTDDECRVPVKINSKIILGSLTSVLVGYQNPACKKYERRVIKN